MPGAKDPGAISACSEERRETTRSRAGPALALPVGDDSSGVGDPNATPGPGSGQVVAEPAPAPARRCNDANACVCAPGFVAAGNDCVAAAVSAPSLRTAAEVCARYAADTAAPAMLVIPAVAKTEQECAKILHYAFGHAPDPSTQCCTMAGAAACSDSLIAGGFSLVTQFDGYALETEQNLIHRRNVLAVGRAGVWAGASGGSADMHYGGAYPALASDPAYVAHPGPGPNVRSKVPSRWFVQKGTATTPALDARVYVVGTGAGRRPWASPTGWSWSTTPAPSSRSSRPRSSTAPSWSAAQNTYAAPEPFANALLWSPLTPLALLLS